jgi:hypothetical protein
MNREAMDDMMMYDGSARLGSSEADEGDIEVVIRVAKC